MSHRRPVFYVLPAAAIAVIGSVFFLASGNEPAAATRRATDRRPVIEATSVLPADVPSDAIIDLNFPATPPTSADVIHARLVILGVTAEAADAAAVRAVEEPGSIDAIVSDLGLGPAEGDKAAELLQAWVAGKPVAFVGLEPSAAVLARVDELIAGGMDADGAAWSALREQSLDQLAAPSSGAQAMSAASSAGQGQVGLDGLSSAPTPNAFCQTCPSFDYMMLEPTATYQTVSGTLAGGANCTIYRFIARSGRTYRFTFCEGGGTASFDSVLDGFSTGCLAVGSNDDFCTLKSRLDIVNNGDGYLYVKVRDKNQLGGTYTLAYADITGTSQGTCSTCPSFDYGTYTPTTTWQTHDGSVISGGCRIYRFYGYVNHSYTFSMCQGGGWTSFDAGLDTFRANCGVGPAADDSCGLAPEVSVSLNATGYIYVKVRGSGGSFRLAYKDTTNDCLNCPNFNHGPLTPTPTWLTHVSSLANGQPCKKYAFNLIGGRTYRWSFCQGGGSASFDTRLTLLNAGCGTVASNDNTCGANAEVTYTPSSTGIYYLDLATNSGFGAYTLAYAELCRPCGDQHATLAAPIFASYTLRSDQILQNGCRVYAVNLTAGYVYRFSTCADTLGAASFDNTITVSTPSCTSPVVNNDACGTAAEVDYTAVTSGAHYVTVAGTGNAFGTFTLATREIGRTCPLSHATLSPTTSFQTVGSSIVRGGSVTYQLNTTASKPYIVTLCSADFGTATAAFDSLVTVKDAVGGCAVIGSNGNACGDDGAVTFLAPSATASVTISGETAAAAGAFTLAYREVPCNDCPNFDFGETVPGTNAWNTATQQTLLPGCSRVHKWDVTAGQKWTFGFCNAPSAATFNTKMTVYTYNGTTCNGSTILVNDSQCTQGGKTQSESATYTVPAGITRLYVRIQGLSASDSGTYKLGYRKQ